MDEMDLEGTPAQQPDDPFKGDTAVTAEQPVQTEQTAQAEPVTAEAQPQTQAQPQDQPAAEAVTEERPKWMKIVELVSVICIAAAGLLAALFMCLSSVKIMDMNYMLSDISDNISTAADRIAESGGDFTGLGSYVTTMFSNAYILLGMLTGIIAGLICGIMLVIKVIQQFALKKKTTMEKTAITSCLFFFAISVMVLSLANSYAKTPLYNTAAGYGDATLAGLIICGILFAAYFIGKIAVNYKTYLSDKTKLINGCMNLAWAVIAMLVLALLSCAPVVVTATESGYKATFGFGFNRIFTSAMGSVLNYGETEIPDKIATALLTQFGWGALGMIIQIWFIFMCGKSLHGAMRGTVAANQKVKLGSQIWRLVFSVIYLLICVLLANAEIDYQYEGFNSSLAAPVVILIFSIIGLVIAIVNKFLVKEKADRPEM